MFAFRRLLLRFLLPAAVFLLPAPDSALAMRCGHELVSIGDLAVEVLEKCGPPLTVNRWEGAIQSRGFFRFNLLEQVIIEEWIYDLGPNKFIRVLRFENGRLVDEETAGKGFD